MQYNRGQVYTVLLFICLILAASSTGLAVCFYQLENAGSQLTGPTGGFDSIIDIKTALAGIDGVIGAVDAQIPQFYSTIGLDSTMIPIQLRWSTPMTAQPAALSVTGRVSELELARQELQSMIGQTGFEANMLGIFFYGRGPTYSIADGVYVNTGLQSAHSVKVTFTIYSGLEGKGDVLCSMDYLLGDIPAGAIVTLGRIACGTGTMLAGSVIYQFQWY